MGIKPVELKFTIQIERNEEGSYTVTEPSLPGCITEGDTWEEAIANAREAIAGYIEALKALGKQKDRLVTVVVHAGKILAPKTLKSILNQADMSVAELKELL